jgi:hypothetical protein
MGVKQGFGYTSLYFDSNTNNNVLLQIPRSENERVITSIHAGYGVADPAAHAFEAGRLLIVAGLLDNVRTPIDPHSIGKPDSVPTILFDLPFNERVKLIDFGPRGFSISSSQEVTVILVAPATAADTWPTYAPMNGFLNVAGYESGKDNPFGELR